MNQFPKELVGDNPGVIENYLIELALQGIEYAIPGASTYVKPIIEEVKIFIPWTAINNAIHSAIAKWTWGTGIEKFISILQAEINKINPTKIS